jgi:hypothetical protein
MARRLSLKEAFQTTLGVQVAAFTGAFATLAGVDISPNPAGPEFQNGAPLKSPQRIRMPFDIALSQAIIAEWPEMPCYSSPPPQRRTAPRLQARSATRHCLRR